jgi:hypothetical protein
MILKLNIGKCGIILVVKISGYHLPPFIYRNASVYLDDIKENQQYKHFYLVQIYN